MSKTQSSELSLKTTVPLINDCITTYCRQQIALQTNNPSARQLWETLETVIAAGGKRIRPYLVLLAYQLCGGQSTEAVIPIATAWEFMHCSLLIHDDIIDRDFTRHGQPNASGMYKSLYKELHIAEPDLSHYANSAALLVGDLSLSAAYQLINSSSVPASSKLEANRLLGEALSTVAGGELADTESVMLPVDVVDALQIADHKTASYSLIGPLQTGASLAGASETVLQQLADFGRAVGIAFQLRDDLLGVFGDDAKTGKPTISDIREGKRTLLLQYAYQAANHQQKQRIDAIVGNPNVTTKQADEFRQIVIKTKAKAKIEAEISDLTNQASAILTAIHGNPAATQSLQELISFLLTRDH